MTEIVITENGADLFIQTGTLAVAPVDVVSQVTIAATGQSLEIGQTGQALTLAAASSIEAVEIPAQGLTLAVSAPQGPQVSKGLAIGPTAPSYAPGEAYLWVQTQLGDGTGFTFWIEDGT